jgi:hypothetical protein
MANHWSSVSTIIIMAGQRILCLSTHLSILVDNSSIDPGTRFSSPSRRWRYWITVQVPAEARLFKIVGAPVMWINNELWSSAEGRRSRCHVDLFRCKLFISGTTVTLAYIWSSSPATYYFQGRNDDVSKLWIIIVLYSYMTPCKLHLCCK